MKKSMLIWNILLTGVSGFLLFIHFTGNQKGGKKGGDTPAQAKEGGARQFRIAYFEMDSLASKLELVKNVKAELSKREEAMNSELDRLSRNFQDKYNYYLSQGQAGTLSQTQSEAASQELKKMDDDLKLRRQQLEQDYSDYMVRRQNEIKSKIETFLREYNKGKDYSYIISYEQGLFYFKDTAYNITADVITGMNTMYPPEKNK